MPKKRTPKTEPPVTIEWRDPPPKIGRKPVDRPEEIAAGMRIRRALEADRRRRGVPREGTIFPGDDIAVGSPDRPIKHGTANTYKHGCRCDECRHKWSQGAAETKRRARARANTNVQAGAQ